MFKHHKDIFNEKRAQADAAIDRFLAKYKWPVARYLLTACTMFAVGYYAHMALTNNTGAALRGTLFSM